MKKIIAALFLIFLLLFSKSIPAYAAEKSPNSIHTTYWKSVRAKVGLIPALDKYWYVEYRKGIKYEGYTTWTGKKRVIRYAPMQFEFEFTGTLKKAKWEGDTNETNK